MKTYSSKILLFGEYTVLLNSLALAIPFDRFKGEWAFIKKDKDSDSTEAQNSNQILKKFLKRFISLKAKRNSDYIIDIIEFETDLENGLYFKSDILPGSGLGSSGALIAAIFDRYAKIKADDHTLTVVKNYLAELESYFHGTSSGIDPMVSYLDSAVLINNRNEPEKSDISFEQIRQNFGLFLINSKQKGNTGDLVANFNNKCKSDFVYLYYLHEQYIPVNNNCIEELSGKQDQERFFIFIEELTGLQLKFFEKMIPEEFVPIIKYGLENKLFYLKLCGSGGGGYFIGFTRSLKESRTYLNEKGFDIL